MLTFKLLFANESMISNGELDFIAVEIR